MPISHQELLAAARRLAADVIHSDNDLASKMEVVAEPHHPGPEAGPSNDELIENSHSENAEPMKGSPVLDGEVKSPERQNVTAIKDAIEAQAEMEIGKPVIQKQKEVEIAEQVRDEKALHPEGAGSVTEVSAPSGAKIVINITADQQGAQKPEGIGGEKKNPRESATSNAGVGAFGGTSLSATPNLERKEAALRAVRTAAISVSTGVDEKGDHMLINMNGREYVLYGKDAEEFRREYAAIKKPEAAVNALVEKYLWKLQPYKKLTIQHPPAAPQKPNTPALNRSRAEGLADSDAYWQGKEKGINDYKRYMSSLQRQRLAALFKAAGDFWGYDNWVTGHTALLINNESSTYSTMRNLVRNALKKKMTPKELGGQFAKFFKRQAEESKKFYAENADHARGQRGEYEGRQLEGRPREETSDKAKDFVNTITDIWYEGGGQSDWEQPSGEVDWEEIASTEMEHERAENPKKYPQTNKEDDKFTKAVGIKMESLKKAKIALESIMAMDVADKHELKIAIDSLKMPDAMLGVMGGPSKEQALQILAKHGLRWDEKDYMAGGKGVKKASVQTAGEGQTLTDEEIEKEAGFNFFFPGQVLREVAPQLQHELVDYPNKTNTPMQYADIVGDKDEVPEEVAIAAALEGALNPTIVAYVSTSPAGAAGIGRDGKPEVLEGAPLRKENDIRGYMFTDEFYGQDMAVPGSAFASLKASKTAGADEAKQFTIFLQKVCGEIAATFVALFKVTSRPILDKVPGKGEIQLAQVEQPQGLSSFNIYNQASRVKYLMNKLTDSEIRDAINTSSAQAAVWHDGSEGGFVYEVFVRIDDIDTESLIATYSFICGTKE